MSESAKTIIKYFSDRFLDLDYYPKTIKDILDLQLSTLKNINNDDIKKFKKLDIITIRDLSKLEDFDYESLPKEAQLSNTTLNNALIASNLINNAWNKRKLYLKKPKLKVVIAGLDYAGKTSLINRLLNDYNYNDMINLEPTIGANVEEYQSDKLDLILWDLGGQKDNINEYLESPERFFIQIDVLIFVFDTQDNTRYDEAIKYLNDLIHILEFLNENPYMVILLNKADFDIVKDPDYQIKVEYLTGKVSEIFSNSDNPWNFEMIPTSIYNYYLNEPEIVRSIKSIFAKEKEKPEQELYNSDIDKKLQKILDINLKLLNMVVSELSDVKRVLYRLSPSNISQSLFTVPFEKVPIDYISSTQEVKKRKKKKSKGDESKVKKKVKFGGPPKRLSTHPSLKGNSEELEVKGKLTKEKIQKVKKSLKQSSPKASTPISDSTTPPSAPKVIDNESLKPPPSPQNILSEIEIVPGTGRREVIMELKEIFKKRGLVTR